jgi:hypothetical protein
MSLPYLHPYLGLSNGLNTLHAAGGAGGGIGGWVELGRTTLGSAGDNIDVTGLADKRYLMILNHTIQNLTNPLPAFRFNADTGTNYAWRYSANGGADGTSTSNTGFYFDTLGGAGDSWFQQLYVSNLSGKEKLVLMNACSNRGGTGASNDPERREIVAKWSNTSDPIDEVNIYDANLSAGNFATGSELVVLGWDPADTHTNNFWEELASVNAGASSTSIDTSTFTAKKYLWIQAFIKSTGSSMGSISANFNNDTGTNYANRYSDNGGADGTITSNIALLLTDGGNLATNESALINFFIVNVSSKEKLVIGHAVKSNTAGAANAPTRRETAQKWTNTSSQITSFKINRDSGSGTFDTVSQIKVWGAD